MAVNFVSLALLQGVNYVLPLISFPFLFRVLGVERWGLVSFGYSLMQYFVMFTDFGFNLSATKYISEHRDDRRAINSYLNSAMLGRALLCGASLVVLLALIAGFDKFGSEAAFYLLYFGMIVGNVMFPMWFFQGMENMKYITVFNIVAKSVSIVPFFVFIRGPEDYIYVPACYSVGFLLAGLISLYIVYRVMGMRWYLTGWGSVRAALRDSSTYFLSRVSTSLFTTTNSFLLGLVCGNTAVGYYSAAEKLYQAYNQLLSPFTGVLFPHIARSHDTRFFKRVFSRVAVANVFCVAATLALSAWVLRLVYGTAEPEILRIFRTLMCGCLITIPSILLGYPFLAAMGHPLFTNWTNIVNNRTRIYPPCISKIETVLQPCSYFLIQWLNGTLQYNVSRFNAFGMAGSQIRFYCMVIKHKLLTQAVHVRKGGGCLVSSFPLEVHPKVE